MIDEKKLDELTQRYRQIKRDEWLDLVYTMLALWKENFELNARLGGQMALNQKLCDDSTYILKLEAVALATEIIHGYIQRRWDEEKECKRVSCGERATLRDLVNHLLPLNDALAALKEKP